MQMLSCPVATYCVGEACSGAAVLLVGGSKGKRLLSAEQPRDDAPTDGWCGRSSQ